MEFVIIATGISFPAYAQSFDADNGTGNLISANVRGAGPDVTGSVTRKSGTEAYAMSARRKVNGEASYAAEPAHQDNGSRWRQRRLQRNAAQLVSLLSPD